MESGNSCPILHSLSLPQHAPEQSIGWNAAGVGAKGPNSPKEAWDPWVRSAKNQTTRLSLWWGEEKEIAPEGDETNLRPDTSLEMSLSPLSMMEQDAQSPWLLLPTHSWLHLPNPITRCTWMNQFGSLIQKKPLWSSSFLSGRSVFQEILVTIHRVTSSHTGLGKTEICPFHSSPQLDQIRYDMNL